jgi:anti-sigma factor RsiW
MTARDSEPGADELLAMAYVDGELDPASRAAFAARLEREPRLAKEVAELQTIELLARQAAPPEPADHEWARVERSTMSRTLGPLSWVLLGSAALGLAAWAIVCIADCGLPLVPKVLVLALVAGIVLRLVLAVRQRARTLPFDPYTKLKR